MTSPLRVALIGAGPAGIYAADILSKTGLEVSIDLYERLPAPFGLVRYGVDLSKVNAVGDLQGGIEEAERLLGYQVSLGGSDTVEDLQLR